MDWIWFAIGGSLLIGGIVLMRMEYKQGVEDGRITKPIRSVEDKDKAGFRRYLAEFSIAMGGFWISRTLVEALTGFALDGFMHILIMMIPTAAFYFGVQHFLWKQVND